MNKYAVGFLFNADGDQVALIRKLRPDWQKGLLNGIGGHVEEGESFLDAMNREFREEAGLDIEWQHYMTLYTTSPERAHLQFFVAVGDPRAAKSVTDEQIEVHFIESLMTRDDVLDGLAWAVAMARMCCMAKGTYTIFEVGA